MRVAVLDLGTNTFHLLIADLDKHNKPEILFRSKRKVKLGEGSIHRHFISEIPFQRGLKALEAYSDIIRKYKAEKVVAYATSAIRSAGNGKEFVKEAYQRTGIRINTISGSREAELIYYGVRQCIELGPSPSLVMDIGGGSTEFIIAGNEKIYWKHSFNIGASRLLEQFQPGDPIKPGQIKELHRYLEKTLEPLISAVKRYPVNTLVGSSGSFDTLAEMIGWKYHRRNVLKGVIAYEFNLEEYEALHKILLSSTTAQRMKMKGLIKMRVDMIVLSSLCTSYVLKKFRLKKMVVSKYALKEGALEEIINHKL